MNQRRLLHFLVLLFASLGSGWTFLSWFVYETNGVGHLPQDAVSDVKLISLKAMTQRLRLECEMHSQRRMHLRLMAEARCKGIESDYHAAEGMIGFTTAARGNIRFQMDEFDRVICEIESKLISTQKRIDDLEREMPSLNSKVEGLQNTAEAKASDISRIESENRALQTKEIDKLAAEVAHFQYWIEHYRKCLMGKQWEPLDFEAEFKRVIPGEE